MLVWLVTGLASLLVMAAMLWACYLWQHRNEAARIVNAIEAADEEELWVLLAERADFRSVREWFGDPALIIAVKSFPRGIKPLLAHGADVNEPGTEWKTTLMHAAAGGDSDICRLLLSHGADPAAQDMTGRTAADWAETAGHDRIACFLRTVGA